MGDGPPGFPQDFSCPVVLGNLTKRDITFRLQDYHLLWLPFPRYLARLVFCNSSASSCRSHVRPRDTAYTKLTSLACTRFRLFPVRSPLLRESRLLYFPPGTKMVHFPGFASIPYVFRYGYPDFIGMGFPIRRSPGQSLFSGSPRLIAASHVLHRLSAPRHPPYTLNNLTIKFRSRQKTRNCFLEQKRFNSIVKERFYIHSPNWGISCFIKKKMVELIGIEPTASGLQSRRSPS